MKYTVYDLITGEILRCGDAPSEWCELQAQNNDEALHIGFAFDANEFFFEGDVPVRKHVKPSPYHEWDWTTKSWLPNLDAAKAAKKAEIEAECSRRLYIPYNGFDTDRVSRERISGTIARLQRGDGLPAGWIGWRDASNQQQWATDDAATVLANLTALSHAIEDRDQALLIAAWQHKANIAALTDIDAIIGYGVCEEDALLGQAKEGESVIVGEFCGCQYVEDGALVNMPERPSEIHTFDYATKQWVDPRTLDDIKLAKWEIIKQARSSAEFGGFTWDGSPFDSDAISQSRIQGALQLAAMAPGSTIDWTLADNTVRALSAADLANVGAALGMHVAAQHAKAGLLRSQIEAATTVAEVDAVTW